MLNEMEYSINDGMQKLYYIVKYIILLWIYYIGDRTITSFIYCVLAPHTLAW